MSTSSRPGHDGDDGRDLSAWERQVLADIEDDLVSTDPRLAREMTQREPKAAPRWWPLTARSTGLLFVALSVLVPAFVVGRPRARHHARRGALAAARRHRGEPVRVALPGTAG